MQVFVCISIHADLTLVIIMTMMTKMMVVIMSMLMVVIAMVMMMMVVMIKPPDCIAQNFHPLKPPDSLPHLQIDQ